MLIESNRLNRWPNVQNRPPRVQRPNGDKISFISLLGLINQISSGPSRGVYMDLEDRRQVNENYNPGRNKCPRGQRKFADHVGTWTLPGQKHRQQRASLPLGGRG